MGLEAYRREGKVEEYFPPGLYLAEIGAGDEIWLQMKRDPAAEKVTMLPIFRLTVVTGFERRGGFARPPRVVVSSVHPEQTSPDERYTAVGDRRYALVGSWAHMINGDTGASVANVDVPWVLLTEAKPRFAAADDALKAAFGDQEIEQICYRPAQIHTDSVA